MVVPSYTARIATCLLPGLCKASIDFGSEQPVFNYDRHDSAMI